MAELFLAQQPPRSELVVIKRILPHISEEPDFVRMFLDEARIAAQLHHPNIVQVFELGRLQDTLFIAMEYVDGLDLRRVTSEASKRGCPLPLTVAARICADVAAGLDHAHHSRGMDGRPLELIHRDISPQNVMVGFNGKVKLVDFGIAKAHAFAERSKPGILKGKFLYLAPEQVSQERLDGRADLFALGIMLYEITVGRAPFARSSTEAILYAIRSEDPPPPHLACEGYPQEFSRIVMRCLAKERNKRYPRASALQADLEAFLARYAPEDADIAGYLSRLMDASSERTVIHAAPLVRAPIDEVPTEGRPKAALPRPVAPLALTEERPTRPERASSAQVPVARPPKGPSPPPPPEDDEDESTVAERVGARSERPAPPVPTHLQAPRVGALPEPPAPRARRASQAPVRRPAPPIADEEEGDDTLSVTSPTPIARLLPRKPTSAPRPVLDSSEASLTGPTSPLALQFEEEEEESTIGFNSAPRPAASSSRKGPLLALALLAALAVGGLWWLSSSESDAPPAAQPQQPSGTPQPSP